MGGGVSSGGGGRVGWGVRVDVTEKLSFCENSKQNCGEGVGSGGGRGFGWGGGQGGCEQRIEFFEKIHKKIGGGLGVLGLGGVRFGGSGWM